MHFGRLVEVRLGLLLRCNWQPNVLLVEVRHAPNLFFLVLRVCTKSLQECTLSPTFRWFTFISRPVIDIPVRFIKKLDIRHGSVRNRGYGTEMYRAHFIELLQLTLPHTREPLMPKGAQEQITL